MTSFERLSNEIFYEIFEYLDICQAYEIFAYLNHRFRYLFVESSLLYRIKLDLLSNQSFQQYCQHLISPNKHRIISLRLVNPFTIDRYFTFFPLDHASLFNLRSLTLNDIQSDKLASLLTLLATFPRFVSLSCTVETSVRNLETIHQLLFALPVLKYCNMTIKQRFPVEFVLPNPAKDCQPSSIEHFISQTRYTPMQLSNLLLRMSRITHLSCRVLLPYWVTGSIPSMHLPHLKHLSIHCHISFIQCEILLYAIVADQLEVLHIRAISVSDYLKANRWEQLITIRFPCLRLFDLQYCGSFYTDDEYQPLIDGFKSRFWMERNWSFAHRCYRYKQSTWLLFSSINGSTENNVDLEEIVVFDSGARIDVQSTHMTLSTQNQMKSTCVFSIDQLAKIIPCERLTHLTVLNDFPIEDIIGLVNISQHIRSLVLQGYSSKLLSLENRNNIQQMILRGNLTFHDVQSLMEAFRYLKCLKLTVAENDLELILRFLIRHIKKQTEHCVLHLVGFLDAHSLLVRRLRKVIDFEGYANSFTIESISDTAYLRW
ncbi:unnamed protein product [Adineta ricciae]|uniref:F-box domain-containing protein n=1 Tax=Adineta ricciae TaxID=249248 RepID=A0A814N1H2_ADIRI|nr:unnamed protein product [Adineta ricciae]